MMRSTTESPKRNKPLRRNTVGGQQNNNRSGGQKWLTRFGVLLFWLAVWQIAAHLIGKEILLPTPWRVLCRFTALLVTAPFWQSVLYTGSKILLGFFAATVTGCLLAAFAAAFRAIRTLLSPFIAAMKAVPVASFVILTLIWLDSASLSVFIAFVMVLPVIYINMLAGFDSCDEKLSEMAWVFRVPLPRRIAYIFLPQSFPYFRSGCTVALGLCWKAGVAAELIGIPVGSIGEQLYFSKVYFQTADLIALTVVIVLLSVGFERLFLLALDRLSAWQEGR